MVNLLLNLSAAIGTTVSILDHSQQRAVEVNGGCADYTAVHAHTFAPISTFQQRWGLIREYPNLPLNTFEVVFSNRGCNPKLSYASSLTEANHARSEAVILGFSTSHTLWNITFNNPAGPFRFIESITGLALTSWDPPAIDPTGGPLTLEQNKANDIRQEFWFTQLADTGISKMCFYTESRPDPVESRKHTIQQYIFSLRDLSGPLNLVMLDFKDNDPPLYVVQAGDIMPVETAFAQPPDPLAELGEPVTREKSLVELPDVESTDSEKASTLVPLEEAYPDGGLRAWLVVLGCFLYACTVFGWGLNWGILQDYYHTTMFPGTSLSVLGTIIGLSNFMMNGSAYFFGGLGDRYCLLMYLSLLASAFATKLYHLFIFQGFFYGLFGGIGMPLYFSFASQWFFKKRGLATGMAVSGTGIGGGIETLIMRQLIGRIGYRNTILAFSTAHAVIWIFAWFLLKERAHPGLNPAAKKLWLPKKVTGSFYSLALSMLIGVFGFLSPYYFSETYTRQIAPHLDPNSLLAAVPLTLMNFCLGIGRIAAGRLADILGPINMFFCSFFFGGLLQMIFWTFARSYASFIVFSILNGLIGACFISLLAVVCAKLFGVEGLSTITGFMIVMNAPGQFAGASIAATVLSSSGNNWTAVAIYSGSMQFVGALCVLYARFKKDRRVFVKV
ncbi:hypothetical protein D9757_010128 [Collybiopsis confluens]|uniref:Major facilitator superfamily (MFS) profile domain-containing protein n=1 Tax=Collybiopsis confluens TaxID=2823264 RepID=A0A8H5LUH7_9AGAR|nr:hypothetical protein D9757_010128 [Collybiopsis confluens]